MAAPPGHPKRIVTPPILPARRQGQQTGDNLAELRRESEAGQGGLHNHTHVVITIAVSRNGRRISPVEMKGLLGFWTLECGQELRPLTGRSETYSLAVYPGGRFLVLGANGSIDLWDSR